MTTDGVDRVAWCATDADTGENEGIGLARYVRLADPPGGGNRASGPVRRLKRSKRSGLVDSFRRGVDKLRATALGDALWSKLSKYVPS